jgi:hypothetical protein
VSDSPVPWNQPLFDHMSEAHGLTLLESEMHEIMLAVDKCRLNIWKAREQRDLTPEAAAVVEQAKEQKFLGVLVKLVDGKSGE